MEQPPEVADFERVAGRYPSRAAEIDQIREMQVTPGERLSLLYDLIKGTSPEERGELSDGPSVRASVPNGAQLGGGGPPPGTSGVPAELGDMDTYDDAWKSWKADVLDETFDRGQKLDFAMSGSNQHYTGYGAGSFIINSIDTGASKGSGMVKAWTDPLKLARCCNALEVAAYDIYTRYTPRSSDNDFFRIVDNEQVVLVLIGTTLYRYSDQTTSSITSFSVNTWYDIHIQYWGTTESDGTWDLWIGTTHYGPFNDAAVTPFDYFIFGDADASVHYGYGEWDYFKVEGRTTGKFLDTFEDGSARDWRTDVDEQAQLNVQSEALTVVSPSASGTIALAYSPYIDYYTQGSTSADWWSVSFDFRIVTSSTTHWTVVLSNNQFTLFVDGSWLKWYCIYSSSYPSNCGNTQNDIVQLTVGTWVYIELQQTGTNGYNIYVNQQLEEQAVFQDQGGPGTPTLRLGDFSTTADYVARAEWDNIRLQGAKGKDGDSDSNRDDDNDGYADDFEKNNYQVVYREDFEPHSTADVAGERPWSLDGDAWAIGAPTTTYTDPSSGYAGSSNVLGTRIDAAYPNNVGSTVEWRAYSPVIVLQFAHSYSSPYPAYPKLIFDHWYRTQTNDVLTVGVLLANYNYWASPPACGTFGAMQDIQSYQGDPSSTIRGADYWSHVELDVTPGGTITPSSSTPKCMRIAFELTSNNDGSTREGWYLDNIALLAATDFNSDDTDGDGLKDHEEFDYGGTTPFWFDTDGDTLTDNEEVRNQYLAICLDGCRSDPLVKDMWFEVDRMNTIPFFESGTLDWIKYYYGAHRIQTHFIDSSTSASYRSSIELNGHSDCGTSQPDYVDYATGNAGFSLPEYQTMDGLYYWILIADDFCDDATAGEAESIPAARLSMSHSNYAELGCWFEDHEYMYGNWLAHEMGHLLGFQHIANTQAIQPWMVGPPAGSYAGSCEYTLDYTVAEWTSLTFDGLG